ncbi:MAG: hypothetical protein ABFD79_07160 [Phycisphaerales bacterium]
MKVKVTTGKNVTSYDDSSTSFHINKGEEKEAVLNANIKDALDKGILVRVTAGRE